MMRNRTELALTLALLLAPIATAQTAWTSATAVPQRQLTSICALQTTGGAGPDITIPDDGNVYRIDGNANCGLITVRGSLVCAPGITAELKTDGILIDGANARLECGISGAPFSGDLTVTIRNDRAFPTGAGERSIIVRNGGTLSLHGKGTKSATTRLNADALAGDGRISVLDASGWQAGDEIFVTTTSTYPDQTEPVTLTDDCPGNVCSFTPTLKHFHYGAGTQDYLGAGEAGTTLTADLRAYVANLERNITIRGDDDAHWANPIPKGGHLMVMAGASLYLDAVELVRMGQREFLGRYPIHWHHAGLITGQYVRNSSIHDSSSRCVALHNAHQGEFSDNVCYNVVGHAIFLENGNEIENTIEGNLIADVIEPDRFTELLESDVNAQISRWRGPAGVWVANPDNTIRDNVVVNAGTGYWHAYAQRLWCSEDPQGTISAPVHGKYCSWVAPGKTPFNVQPSRSLTRLYENNVAVSSRVGHSWDGGPNGALVGSGNEFNRMPTTTAYQPPSQQTFESMHAYRSQKTGVYYRGTGQTALIKNAVIAEAPIGWFGTGTQDFFDSVFIGISDAYQGLLESDEDFYYHVDDDFLAVDRGNINHLFRGWGLYDGSNHFRHVTFDYPDTPMVLGGKEITPVPISIFGRAHFANHVLQQIAFTQEPYRRINLDAQTFTVNWKDVEASESIFDVDGSLFGERGFIRPDVPWNEHAGCGVRSSVLSGSTVLHCAPISQSLKIQMAETNGAFNPDHQEFTARRLDTQTTISHPTIPNPLFDKFQLIDSPDTPVSYMVEDLNFKSAADGNLFWIETYEQGDWSPLIGIPLGSAVNLPSGCATVDDFELRVWPNSGGGMIKLAGSLQEIRDFEDPTYKGAYYRLTGSNTLVIKLSGGNLIGSATEPFQHKGHAKFDLVCP